MSGTQTQHERLVVIGAVLARHLPQVALLGAVGLVGKKDAEFLRFGAGVGVQLHVLAHDDLADLLDPGAGGTLRSLLTGGNLPQAACLTLTSSCRSRVLSFPHRVFTVPPRFAAPLAGTPTGFMTTAKAATTAATAARISRTRPLPKRGSLRFSALP
ncbi:hypothetical protein LUX57_46075 [Actinomadura madurae]|nr:hypothetical protein [Actinomadura madurae]MCP9971574.1 hypothetical protein [Actinomadura madurae]